MHTYTLTCIHVIRCPFTSTQSAISGYFTPASASHCAGRCFSALLSFLYVWHCSSIRSLRVALSSLALSFTSPLNLGVLSALALTYTDVLTDVKIHSIYDTSVLIGFQPKKEYSLPMRHSDAAVFSTLLRMNRLGLIKKINVKDIYYQCFGSPVW